MWSSWGRMGQGPMGLGRERVGAGRAHLSGIENANDARDNRAVLTFVFLADELNVSKFAEVEITLLLQPVHGQLQIQKLLGDKVEFRPEIPASDSPSCPDRGLAFVEGSLSGPRPPYSPAG